MQVTVYASRRRPLTPVPSPRRDTVAIVGGITASLAFGIGMLLLRSTIEVRSIPERLMEWLLLFIPPSVFEALLRQFGFDAKRYGLDAAIVVILERSPGSGTRHCIAAGRRRGSSVWGSACGWSSCSASCP